MKDFEPPRSCPPLHGSLVFRCLRRRLAGGRGLGLCLEPSEGTGLSLSKAETELYAYAGFLEGLAPVGTVLARVYVGFRTSVDSASTSRVFWSISEKSAC